MNINIHIERLVLDGLTVAPGQHLLVQAAVETELARLLTAEGLSAEFLAGGAMPSVRAGGIHLMKDSNPKQLGQQIARAVYKGIGTQYE
jgi:hypothetical protein